MKKQLNKNAGFTLVELMTVVVILGILSAILVPVLYQAQRSMYKVCCQTQQDYLVSLISQYQNGSCDNMYLKYTIATDDDGNEKIEGVSQKGQYRKWTAGDYQRKTNTWSNALERETIPASELDGEKDGSLVYLAYYVDKSGKGSTVKVAEIICETEGERFLRYAYDYGVDDNGKVKKMKDFKLSSYGESNHNCSIDIVTVNGNPTVVCEDSFHKRQIVKY